MYFASIVSGIYVKLQHSDIISFIRRRLRFELLRTCLTALGGYRGKKPERIESPISELDLNLVE